MKYKFIEKKAYLENPLIFNNVKWIDVPVTSTSELISATNISIIKEWYKNCLYEVVYNGSIGYLWLKK